MGTFFSLLRKHGLKMWGIHLLGFLIMMAIAWALDQSQKVPDLFVEVSDLDTSKAATGSGTA